MQWISERDASDTRLMHHALALQPDDPIEPAYVEFWKRILSDGCAHAASSGWQSLSIEICERQTEADDQGWMHVKFRNGEHKACKGVAEYFLRSDAFACLEVPGEERMAERRRQLLFFLEQYGLLKQAAARPRCGRCSTARRDSSADRRGGLGLWLVRSAGRQDRSGRCRPRTAPP